VAIKAGHGVASLDALYDRLAAHRDSGSPRPVLGQHVHIGLVSPFVVAYRHVPGRDLVGVIRVVHGSRRLTRKLLRGDA